MFRRTTEAHSLLVRIQSLKEHGDILGQSH